MSCLSPSTELTRASSRSCFRLDPTQDPRWARFVERHPNSAVFHTAGWLNALRRTYGYEPVVYTTSPPTSELQNGVIFCRVNSWLTGNRLVSLPFSDHCDPLCDSIDDLDFLVRYLKTAVARHKWQYLEVRPTNRRFAQVGDANGFRPAPSYFLHILDLGPDLEKLFQSFDKDSVQRRILRAERAGLTERCGRAADVLRQFYALFVITRRRHQLPPPPFSWFQNLLDCLGEGIEIRVAYKGDTPVSAIVTLRHGDTVYYKYGGSLEQFKQFAGTPWLLWRAIAAGKSSGATKFDMGRSDVDDSGLLRFKGHWVPRPEPLVYWTFPPVLSLASGTGWKKTMGKRLFSLMPDCWQTFAGKLIYRHIG